MSRDPDPVNLQAKVKPETHLWLKIAIAERQCTLGDLIDELVRKEAKRAKPRE